MSPHHAGPRAKASAIYVQPANAAGEMTYRTFTRPMAVNAVGKKGMGVKSYPAGKATKSKKVARPSHQRKRSTRDGQDE